MEKKYLIMPGYIISRSDGDRHFIGSAELIRLYGVNREECVELPHYMWAHPNIIVRQYSHLIPLQPRYDGKYRETYEEIKNKKIPNQI